MTDASSLCPRCSRAVDDLDIACPFCDFQFRLPLETTDIGGARSHAGVPAYVQEEARMRRWKARLQSRDLSGTLGRWVRLAVFACAGLAILYGTWAAWRWYHPPPWVVEVEVLAEREESR